MLRRQLSSSAYTRESIRYERALKIQELMRIGWVLTRLSERPNGSPRIFRCSNLSTYDERANGRPRFALFNNSYAQKYWFTEEELTYFLRIRLFRLI